MVFVAIITGIAALLNYAWQANFELSSALQIVSIAVQAILTAVTIFAAVRYRGRRQRMGYEGYKVFTFPFAIIFISLLGNAAILFGFIMDLAGVMQI